MRSAFAHSSVVDAHKLVCRGHRGSRFHERILRRATPGERKVYREDLICLGKCFHRHLVELGLTPVQPKSSLNSHKLPAFFSHKKAQEAQMIEGQAFVLFVLFCGNQAGR